MAAASPPAPCRAWGRRSPSPSRSWPVPPTTAATSRSTPDEAGGQLQHALAGIDASSQERGQSLAMEGGVTEAQLIQLAALEEEVQIVLPREADAAVHLQARRHHPPAGVGAP